MFIDLHILNDPCISGTKPTWSWWMIFLMCVCTGFLSVLLKYLRLCSLGIRACSSLLLLCLSLVWVLDKRSILEGAGSSPSVSTRLNNLSSNGCLFFFFFDNLRKFFCESVWAWVVLVRQLCINCFDFFHLLWVCWNC